MNQGGGPDNYQKKVYVNEYAGILISPDAVRDGLVEKILHDLYSILMQILWEKRWRIENSVVVAVMYPQQAWKPSFASVAKTLLAGDCIVIVARGVNLYANLQEIKGKIRFNEALTEIVVSGLRLKYRSWTFEDLEELKNPASNRRQEILDKVFEFRIHTTDDLCETALLCSLCMEPTDEAAIRQMAPELAHEIAKIKMATF